MKKLLSVYFLLLSLTGTGTEKSVHVQLPVDSVPGSKHKAVRPIDAKSFILPGSLIRENLLVFAERRPLNIHLEAVSGAAPV